jgi:hypothetical protein
LPRKLSHDMTADQLADLITESFLPEDKKVLLMRLVASSPVSELPVIEEKFENALIEELENKVQNYRLTYNSFDDECKEADEKYRAARELLEQEMEEAIELDDFDEREKKWAEYDKRVERLYLEHEDAIKRAGARSLVG